MKLTTTKTSRRWPAAALWTVASAILALLVVDVVRQLQLGTASASLAFVVVASGVAVAAALMYLKYAAAGPPAR